MYGNAELSERLGHFLRPPPNSESKRNSKRQEAQWKRRAEERSRKENENKKKWKVHLTKNIENLRDPGFSDPRDVSTGQWYLHGKMREGNEFGTRWTQGDWHSLVPEFGEEIAFAFRDGAVAHWRKADPFLQSEGAEENSTPASVIFGLTGLEIESREVADWTSKFTDVEVKRACGFASYELNGFPTWFAGLFDAYPDVVSNFLMQEIEFELSVETEKKNRHYILSDVSWSGQWTWQVLGHRIFDILKAREPVNVENLDQLLKVLQGSQVSDAALAELAASKTTSVTNPANLARWYAVWVGVAPQSAIPALHTQFNQINDEDTTSFAMNFITKVVGDRRSENVSTRSAFRTPTHLKSLYLLMHTYIQRKDDIERAGKGGYSPDLRDHAQDARNSLFEMLRKIPGKEAFLALDEISNAHPDETSRPWVTYLAKSKAQEDSDLQAWSISQVKEFHDSLERTPANNRELAELAVFRILDMKDDLENGDESLADILLKGATLETEMRRYIGRELREKAFGRYNLSQEEELADAKKPDLRFLGVGFDGAVPVELKLANSNWSGSSLFERLENQLCGDYLRDNRSNRGVFVLVYRGDKFAWQLPGGAERVDFDGIVRALQSKWEAMSANFPGIEEVTVIGIDLTKRTT